MGWPKEKGRDGERTPMQWSATPGAGFTTAPKSWLPIPPTSDSYNVDKEKADPNSIFNTYRTLLALRKSESALRDGSYESIGEDANVFAFVRRSGSAVVVALNMSGQTQSVDLSGNGVAGRTVKPLYRSSGSMDAVPLKAVTLEPFGVLVGKMQ